MRASRIIAFGLSVVVAASALIGCGTKSLSQSTAPSQKNPVTLTVWTTFQENEIAYLQKIADEWGAKTGNKVKITKADVGFQDFATAAQTGNGPDIAYGIPHDNLGAFWKAGLLSGVPEGTLVKDAYVPLTIDAVSFENKQYALPLGMEAIALFYNTKLVPQPPTDWNTFLAEAKQHGFMYNIKEPYFSFGFISGMGGYIFKKSGNGLDVKDIGLNNDGAVQGMQLISDMIHTWHLMPKDVDYDVSKGKFQSGKSAFWLTGSWEVQGLKDAHTPFAVAPMPSLPNGQPFRPFVGVMTGFVYSGSKHQAEAWDLMKYLQARVDDFDVLAAHRIPVTKAGLEREDFKFDKIISAFAASALNGTPMPNVPEMQAVWPAFAQAMQVIAAGSLKPKDAADKALTQIQQGMSQLK